MNFYTGKIILELLWMVSFESFRSMLKASTNSKILDLCPNLGYATIYLYNCVFKVSVVDSQILYTLRKKLYGIWLNHRTLCTDVVANICLFYLCTLVDMQTYSQNIYESVLQLRMNFFVYAPEPKFVFSWTFFVITLIENLRKICLFLNTSFFQSAKNTNVIKRA